MNKTIAKLLVVALCVSNAGFVFAGAPVKQPSVSACQSVCNKAGAVKQAIGDNVRYAGNWIADTKLVKTVSGNTAKVVKYVTFQNIDPLNKNKDLALRSLAAAAVLTAITYGAYKLFCPCAQDNCDVEEVEYTVIHAPVAQDHSTVAAIHTTVKSGNENVAQVVAVDVFDVVEDVAVVEKSTVVA